MKKLAAILTLCIVFSLLCVVAGATTLSHNTTFRISTADPWVISGSASGNPTYSDWYYHTKTGTSRVAIIPTKNINNFYDGTNGYDTDSHIHYDTAGYIDPDTGVEGMDPTVYTLFGEGATINGTWSPEIHYFSEEDFPGMSGWYMYVALRQKYEDTTGESSRIRMVVLKSPTASAAPSGKDYVHPVTKEANYSQPLLKDDGSIYNEWACGQTILRIKEGEHAGIYVMWVAEEGRGETGFHQIIRIAKLKSPWQIDGEIGTITTPTQPWEMSGKPAATEKYPDKVLPHVVEGATPIYGKNGEIFIIYCGSGYWTGGNYALGQLTWTGGDPLDQNSWVKLGTDKNPIFDAKRDTNNLDGAGHASFIQDKDGNGFAIYHAYPYGTWIDKKDKDKDGNTSEYYDGFKYERYAFIEPYYIDYNTGIVHIGLDDDGSPADFTTATVSFNQDTSLDYLTAPTASCNNLYSSLGATELLMQDSLADSFTIYRKASGEDFYSYYDTTTDTVYNDADVAEGGVYSYRIYSYREEEISPDCAEVEVEIPLEVAAPSISKTETPIGEIGIKVTAMSDCDTLTVYRADTQNGVYEEIRAKEFEFGEGYSITITDSSAEEGNTYYYKAIAQNGKWLSDYSNTLEVFYPITSIPAPSLSSSNQTCTEVTLNFSGDIEYDSFIIYRGSMITDLAEYATTSETSYTVTDMKIGQAYVYQVVGIKDDIESDGSAVHYITLNHFAYEVAAKDATCTEDGYESYSYCLKCKETLIEKVIVPAKGHSYAVIEEEIPATETSEGKTAVEKCSVCGDTRGGEVIPQLNPGSGDVNGDGKVTLGDVLLAFKTGGSEADMDGDGRITLHDILLLIKMILNG